jgi:hypothetical protein
MLVAQFCFLRPKSTPRRLEVQKFFIHTKIIHIFCCAPEINSLRGWHVNVSSAQIEQIHISPDDKSGVFHKKEVILTWCGTHLFRVKNICSARIQLIAYLRSGGAKKKITTRARPFEHFFYNEFSTHALAECVEGRLKMAFRFYVRTFWHTHKHSQPRESGGSGARF